jgi:L-lactate dehydrogenase complex protein LldE
MRNHRQKPEKVYYFGTCLADMFYPEAGLAGIKLIQQQGVRVVFPSQQTCCGQPAYNSGFPAEARAVARKQMDIFYKDYPIVVPSGSCAGMMKHHYPKLFEFENDPILNDIKDFSERIYELSEFLVNVLNIQLEDKGEPIKVTWHSSCHAMREMKVTEVSKSLIRQLKNVELLDLENEYECCGFGGTFAVKQPALSGVMVNDKVDYIKQSGATRVLAGDCGCLMNITGAMEYRNVPISGQHLAEFIWERINGEPSST